MAEPASPAAAGAAGLEAEEAPLARFTAVQTTQTGWRKANRVLVVSATQLRVLDPATLQTAHAWHLTEDVADIAAPVLGGDEFTVNVRDAKAKKGKATPYTFSVGKNRASVLAAIARRRAKVSGYEPQLHAGQMVDAQGVQHMALLSVHPTELRVVDPRTGRTARAFPYVDMPPGAIVRESQGAFVVYSRAISGREPHVYICPERNLLLSQIVDYARTKLGVPLEFDVLDLAISEVGSAAAAAPPAPSSLAPDSRRAGARARADPRAAAGRAGRLPDRPRHGHVGRRLRGAARIASRRQRGAAAVRAQHHHDGPARPA
jgi:hypothetical protein